MLVVVWSAREVTWRRSVVSGTAMVVAVVLISVLVPRRTGTQRGQIDSGSVVMLGDSITEQAEWDSLLPDLPIVNHGYSGYTTEQLVPLAESVGDARPHAVLVLTGTNDIRDGRSPEWTAGQLRLLLDAFAKRSPDTIVVVQTVLPRDDHPTAAHATNDAMKAVAASRGARVLDLHGAFDNGAGGLRSHETTDGVHLSTSGYRRWAALLAPLITSFEFVADASGSSGS